VTNESGGASPARSDESKVDPDVIEALARIFEANRQHRAARASTALSTMSRHERRLVKEAAVMGYVLGYRSGNLDGRAGIGGPLHTSAPFPGDASIVRQVIEHCDSTDDLYPYIAALCAGRRRRVTKKRRWPGESAYES
jgi:hypothetical protein